MMMMMLAVIVSIDYIKLDAFRVTLLWSCSLSRSLSRRLPFILGSFFALDCLREPMAGNRVSGDS
jgi:hypothetical protein